MIHEWSVQSIDGQLSLHLHVGVDPNLLLGDAHALVDRLEQIILARQPQIRSVHTHIELLTPDILPSAHVSSGLQQRVASAVERAVDTIPYLTQPHDIQVRQVEGRLFVTVEVLVDGALSVTEAHELSTRLQEAIRANVPNVSEALVHLEPQEE